MGAVTNCVALKGVGKRMLDMLATLEFLHLNYEVVQRGEGRLLRALEKETMRLPWVQSEIVFHMIADLLHLPNLPVYGDYAGAAEEDIYWECHDAILNRVAGGEED